MNGIGTTKYYTIIIIITVHAFTIRIKYNSTTTEYASLQEN